MSIKSPNTTKVERGAYSAIVYQDGDFCVAEDNVGAVIKENSDAATTIQAAIDSLDYGKLVIAQGDYNIPSANINVDTNAHKINIQGEGFGGYCTTPEKGTKLIFSNSHGIYFTGNGWRNSLKDMILVGDGTGKAISNDVPAGNFNYVTFENITFRNFDTGVELSKVVVNRFVNLYFYDVAKSFRLLSTSWSPYLENVRAGYGTATEGIYLAWGESALLLHCDGGDATTYTFRLKGYGITVLSPYAESGSGPMQLTGSGVQVIGGFVQTNVYLGYDDAVYNIYLDMVNYTNRNSITFTVNASYDSSHIIIDTGSWSPTITDANHRALRRSTNHSGNNRMYEKYSGAGHHYVDLLAIPTSLPSYGVIAGTMYFDTSTKALKIYDGAAWKSVTLT